MTKFTTSILSSNANSKREERYGIADEEMMNAWLWTICLGYVLTCQSNFTHTGRQTQAHKHIYAKMVAFIAMTEAVWFVDFLAIKVEKVPACLSILSHGFGHSRHGVCLSTAWRFLLEGCAASQG